MRLSPHLGCMYFASSGTLRISSLRILATICRISHCALVQRRRSPMCSSSAKLTMIWKLVGAALGRTKRASSAGMPAATASR